MAGVEEITNNEDSPFGVVEYAWEDKRDVHSRISTCAGAIDCEK